MYHPFVKSFDKMSCLSFDLAQNSTEKLSSPVMTIETSKEYILTMLRRSLLNILHCRLYLPEDEIKEKVYHGVPYVGLTTRKPQNQLLILYKNWMRRIDQGIKHNYLKSVCLFLKNRETGSIEEYYQFQLKYHEECKKSQTNVEVLIEHTSEMLTVIKKLENTPKLEKALIYFEYIYYWNVSTALPSDVTLVKNPQSFEILPKKLIMSVNTGYHTLRLKVDLKYEDSLTDRETLTSYDVEMDIPNLNCVCRINFIDDIPQYKCDKCNVIFHLPCYGIFTKKPPTETIECLKCGYDDNELNADKCNVKYVGIVRLLVYFLCKDGRIKKDVFECLSMSQRKTLHKWLAHFNVPMEGEIADRKALDNLVNAVSYQKKK